MEKLYQVSNKRIYVKKASIDFSKILSLNVGISTIKDFDWYFDIYRQFLFSKDIELEKSDTLTVYFISSKKMSNEFIGGLLDDCFLNTLHLKDVEEIIGLMGKGWRKINLDNLLVSKVVIGKKLKV